MPGSSTSTRLVRPLRGGQITIPAAYRRSLGIDEHTVLEISLVGDELRLKPLHVSARSSSAAWLKELYDYFAPVREEAAAFSKQEINEAIDEAIAEVRAAHADRRS